jgi:hypothetical protein
LQKLKAFIAAWQDTNGLKPLFSQLHDQLQALEGTALSFTARPGVSFSLRARRVAQHARHLFVMVDVVDDDPENRWLSVCFYGDMISDPSGEGELIPKGLLGKDGYCFDLDRPDTDLLAYLQTRIQEAHSSALV